MPHDCVTCPSLLQQHRERERERQFLPSSLGCPPWNPQVQDFSFPETPSPPHCYHRGLQVPMRPRAHRCHCICSHLCEASSVAMGAKVPVPHSPPCGLGQGSLPRTGWIVLIYGVRVTVTEGARTTKRRGRRGGVYGRAWPPRSTGKCAPGIQLCCCLLTTR